MSPAVTENMTEYFSTSGPRHSSTTASLKLSTRTNPWRWQSYTLRIQLRARSTHTPTLMSSGSHWCSVS